MRASWGVPRAAPARSRRRSAATASSAPSRTGCARRARRAAACSRSCRAGAATTSRARSASRATRPAPRPLIANGRERAIDLGVCGERAFVGIASCGFDSDANRIANETRVPGDAAYLYGALRALAAWRPARFELELDGERLTHVGYSVAAANGRQYGGGMVLAPGSSLDDGMFDVVTVSDVPKRRFLRGLPRVFSGKHVLNDEVDVRRARELRIAADRPFTLYADGDPIAELPATVRTLPAAVRVIVP